MKNNFRSLVVALGIISVTPAIAQKDNVGIGTSKPDQSAVLDISSSNKGLLMPRMSLQQRNSIQSPAKGLIVYQTDMLSGFYFYDGAEWKPLVSETSANSVAADPNDWTLNGNANATATSFLGTPAGIPINFMIGTTRAARIDASNTSFGSAALNSNTTGFLNIAFGLNALNANTTGNSNVSLGPNALSLNTTGNNNTAVGRNTLQKNTIGGNNVALGINALNSNTTGVANLGLGGAALYSNTTAGNNVGIGDNALFKTTTGGFNVGIGAQSQYNNTTGVGNISFGYRSLYTNSVGNFNIAIGREAGYLNTGTGSMFLGYQAGFNETGSNKLYIANSSTANPLIKGEFDNKNLKVNTGAIVSSTVGFLAVGNFDAAYTMPASNSYRLIVQDGIITEKVKVALKSTADWADYVFEPSYKLMSLEKVEEFVKENKHLPNVPSAEDMSKNGLDVSQTSAKLMEKIEELTLYMIEMNKEIKALKAENEKLKNK